MAPNRAAGSAVAVTDPTGAESRAGVAASTQINVSAGLACAAACLNISPAGPIGGTGHSSPGAMTIATATVAFEWTAS